MSAYALLSALAYFILDQPFRLIVWIFCGGLAVMTLARAKYEQH